MRAAEIRHIRNEPRIGIVKTAICAQAPIAVLTMPMRGSLLA